MVNLLALLTSKIFTVEGGVVSEIGFGKQHYQSIFNEDLHLAVQNIAMPLGINHSGASFPYTETCTPVCLEAHFQMWVALAEGDLSFLLQ